jgi:hypothetical protein
LQTFNGGTTFKSTVGASTAQMNLHDPVANVTIPWMHNYSAPGVGTINNTGNPGGNLFIGGGGNFTMASTTDSNIGIGGYDVENGPPYLPTLSSINNSCTENVAIGNGNMGLATSVKNSIAVGAACLSASYTIQNTTAFGSNIAGLTGTGGVGTGGIDSIQSCVFCGSTIGGTLTGTTTGNTIGGANSIGQLGTNGNQDYDTVWGFSGLDLIAGGSYNTAIGAYAGYLAPGNGSGILNNVVYLGAFAGKYGTTSNEFFLNNQDRTNYAGDQTKSLLYGVFNATAASQTLTINGVLKLPYQLQSTVSTGTAPFTVSSTTNVANLNASSLNGATFAAPGAIGGTTPSSGAFTTVSQTGKTTTYNNVVTVGWGHPAEYGMDFRQGLTSGDGAAITLYTAVNGTSVFRITADIFATAAVTGTAVYTLTWTQHATTQTLVVNSTTINTLATATDLINPDNGTAITARLTGSFTGTFTVSGLVEQL